MTIWIKAHWKLLAICFGVLIVLIWYGSITGTNAKLYNMMISQLKTDENRAIEDQKKYIKDCEDEIVKLRDDKLKIQQQQTVIAKREAGRIVEVQQLKGRINVLETALRNINVSGDPDRVLEDLRSRGINVKKYNR